ncbi:hypothetical protein ABZ896_24055 [Streptomyces sp. NPDC047072]|uniref:hypothetical protein n=1 Tax=Streptomyces sp. NPDC047072 TaxID=3154809 RepID=UPI0033ED9026
MAISAGTAHGVPRNDKRASPLDACHPTLPPLVIAELLADADWRVVEAAASNPSLPPAVMWDLVSRQ